MEQYFEVCHTQIPFNKIIEYRILEREYIYRPAYYVTTDLFRGKKYRFTHMVPYAAIYSEAEYKSAIKAFKALTLGNSVAKDAASGILSTIGDKLNIKVWKYSKFTCRNQAGRVFSTYLQDVPASVETSDGKRSEVYPNDQLYRELGEPIAPSIEFIPALLILTKDELFTFYGNGIQIDAEAEYQRLKQEMSAFLQEKEAGTKKLLVKTKPTVSQISAPRISIRLPQLGKNKPQIEATKNYIDVEAYPIEQTTYDPMDLNHDGVVDEKDMEIFRQRIEQQK